MAVGGLLFTQTVRTTGIALVLYVGIPGAGGTASCGFVSDVFVDAQVESTVARQTVV